MSTIDTLPNSASQTHPLDLTAKQIGVAVVRLVGRAVMRCARLVYACQQRASERRALRSLDERMLADLGLSRGDVDNAFASSPWRDR